MIECTAVEDDWYPVYVTPFIVSDNPMLDLAIIIVNFNTCEYLHRCLTSVYGSRGDFTFEVCVVDNASADGSIDMIKAEFPQVRLIESPINGGYAYANNLGLRACGFEQEPPSPTVSRGQLPAQKLSTSSPAPASDPEAPRYALLLNPDTVLPPDGLDMMLDFMNENHQAGAAGPKLVLEDGTLDLACRRSFPTPQISFYRITGLSKLFPRHHLFGQYNLTYCDPDQTMEVDSVVGAFMLVRREAIEKVGLLDEDFFMYGEDLDWAYRMVQVGWKTYYHPAVTVRHVKRAASRHSPRAQQEFYRAMHTFYNKHYASTTPWWLHWLVLAGINLRAGLLQVQLKLAPDGK
jgi:GT2 family glycosyltransferase